MTSDTKTDRLLRLLETGKGEPLSSEALARRMNIQRPSLNAAIHALRKARPDLVIETVPGEGYRLVSAPAAAAPAVVPSSLASLKFSPPAATTFGEVLAAIDQATAAVMSPAGLARTPPPAGPPLSRTAAKMLAVLEANRGQFVPGRTLADAMDTDVDNIGNYAKELRGKRPDLRLQSRQGSGYGLDVNEAGMPPAPKRVVNAGSYNKEQNYRDTLDLLRAIDTSSAELVRRAALECNQPVQAALERLIQYGWEVQRDLIASGEHPLSLRRAA